MLHRRARARPPRSTRDGRFERWSPRRPSDPWRVRGRLGSGSAPEDGPRRPATRQIVRCSAVDVQCSQSRRPRGHRGCKPRDGEVDQAAPGGHDAPVLTLRRPDPHRGVVPAPVPGPTPAGPPPTGDASIHRGRGHRRARARPSRPPRRAPVPARGRGPPGTLESRRRRSPIRGPDPRCRRPGWTRALTADRVVRERRHRLCRGSRLAEQAVRHHQGEQAHGGRRLGRNPDRQPFP